MTPGGSKTFPAHDALGGQVHSGCDAPGGGGGGGGGGEMESITVCIATT